MKCNRCGKDIDELEIFCSECKNELKKNSSKSDVKQLEELIENQKRLNDLENTKELVDLDKLVNVELEKQEIDNKTQVFEVKDEVKNIIDSKQNEIDENEFFIEEKKSNKKSLIIIISIISVILIIGLVLLFIFLNKDKEVEEEKEVVINYEKIINTYGDLIVDIVKDYMSTNNEVPTWLYVIEEIDYERYEVICDIHNIYSDGSIYLSECTVDSKEVDYTYGTLLEEIKEGKKISIYKEDSDGLIVYSSGSANSSKLIGIITCKTDACDYISAYDKYVLIKEKNEYYLYDYTNDSMNFGPFLLNSEYDLLVDNNTLYGILYKEENKNNIYNVKTGKILKNIKGYLLPGEMGFNPSIMYKYNYVVLVNNSQNDFVNLKTGNVSYTIKENIGSFIEEEDKKIVYITAYPENSDNFKIYNSNGKSLFDGKEYSDFIVGTNNLLVSTDTNFKVYDDDLKVKTSSNDYDQIIGLYEDFVVVSKDSNLIILSIEDEILTTFENGWDNDNYILHYNLSNKDNDKITLIVENKKLPSGTNGSYIEYYYNLLTKESGFTEKSSIE